MNRSHLVYCVGKLHCSPRMTGWPLAPHYKAPMRTSTVHHFVRLAGQISFVLHKSSQPRNFSDRLLASGQLAVLSFDWSNTMNWFGICSNKSGTPDAVHLLLILTLLVVLIPRTFWPPYLFIHTELWFESFWCLETESIFPSFTCLFHSSFIYLKHWTWFTECNAKRDLICHEVYELYVYPKTYRCQVKQ